MTEEERTAAALLLQAARKQGWVPCEQCSIPTFGYTSGPKRRRFCSNRCRSKAQYYADKERKAALGVELLGPAQKGDEA